MPAVATSLPWREFVIGHSNVRKESVVKHFLYNRLQNLWTENWWSGTASGTA